MGYLEFFWLFISDLIQLQPSAFSLQHFTIIFPISAFSFQPRAVSFQHYLMSFYQNCGVLNFENQGNGLSFRKNLPSTLFITDKAKQKLSTLKIWQTVAYVDRISHGNTKLCFSCIPRFYSPVFPSMILYDPAWFKMKA